MTTNEIKSYIDRTLGNSIRCHLPSYWWKRLFGAVVDKLDEKVDASNLKTIGGESLIGEGDITIVGEKGDKGDQGEQGTTGPQGPQGVSVTSVVQTTTSSADGGSNVVTVTLSDGKTSTFTVKNGSKGSQGEKGDTGAEGPKGDKGEKGADGAQGLQGERGEQGPQGNSGYTGAADELEVVNNLTQGGATAALSAEQGKVLKGELTELSAEINASLNGGETTRVIADFVDKGKFLYENDTLDSAQYNISEYIDILGASKVEMTNLWEASNGILAYVIYDASKRVIFKSAIPTTTGLVNVVLSAKDLPVNSAYIRATENTLHDAEIIVTYIAEEGLKQRIDALEMQDATFSKKIARIEEEISGESVGMVMGKIKNLITDFTTFSAQHLNTKNGEIVASASFTTSAFIAVNAATAYAGGVKDLKHGGYKETTLQEICFYDSNQQFLSAVTSKSTFTTPENTAFIRFSVLSSVSMGEKGIDDIAMCEIVEGNAPISVFSKDFIDNAIVKGGLYGKKWLLIGDSNTEHNFRAAAKYDEFISADTGVIPTNIGKSGAGYRVYQNAEYVFLNIFNQFISKNPNYQPDFITIMGGSNDILYDWENIGSKNDTTNASVFGMARILIERIKEVYPTTPFAIMTPFPHDYAENTPHIAEFVTELKGFCFDNNIPCLDLQFNSGLRPTEAAFNKKYYSCASSPDGDGLHLNYFGQQLIASRIKAFLTEYYG